MPNTEPLNEVPNFGALMSALEVGMNRVREHLEAEHRDKGGYFRLFQLLDPAQGLVGLWPLSEFWLGGKSNIAKQPKYKVFSFEKAIRLSHYAPQDHVSSWQSHDTFWNQFGGAIRFRCELPNTGRGQTSFIFSFSGLPEEADEGLMLWAARIIDNPWGVDLSDLRRIREISKNKFIPLEYLTDQ